MKWILYQLWLLGWFKFETPNKEARIKAYEQALIALNYDIKKYTPATISYGLCFYIKNPGPQHYIELFYLRPYFNYSFSYWWHPQNYKVRLKVLNKAIELAKKSNK